MAFTAHPQDCMCFHTVLNLQENQRLVAHHRTQPFQHTVLNPYHRTQLLPYNLHHRTQPLKDNFLDRTQLYIIPLHKSARICIRMTRMGPLPALRSPHFQNGLSHASPLLLSARTCKASQRCRAHPLLCPKVTKATLPRVPHAFAQTAYPSQPTPLEQMVNMSHWGPLEDAPPQAILSSCFISAVQWASLTSGNPQSQHSSSPSFSTSRSEMLDSSGAWGSCSNANICCLSSSKHLCMLQLAWHHREYHPQSSSGQSAKSTSWCQRQSLPPCLGNGSSSPVMPFQSYSVHPPPPSVSLEATPRESCPHGTTCYMVGTGFLHPVASHALLPHYVSCRLCQLFC